MPQGPDRFYNRELSWLQFNRRVLEEAGNKQHPLLERLRFLSIAAANLDEFYMVRAAGVYGQVRAGISTLSQDGLTPMQQLAAINKFATRLVADKQANWRDHQNGTRRRRALRAAARRADRCASATGSNGCS